MASMLSGRKSSYSKNHTRGLGEKIRRSNNCKPLNSGSLKEIFFLLCVSIKAPKKIMTEDAINGMPDYFLI